MWRFYEREIKIGDNLLEKLKKDLNLLRLVCFGKVKQVFDTSNSFADINNILISKLRKNSPSSPKRKKRKSTKRKSRKSKRRTSKRRTSKQFGFRVLRDDQIIRLVNSNPNGYLTHT